MLHALGSNAILAVGDPGLIRDGLRVAFEACDFCNEVGKTRDIGRQIAANCFDLSSKPNHTRKLYGHLCYRSE